MQDNNHIFKVLPYEGATTIDMYNKWAKEKWAKEESRQIQKTQARYVSVKEFSEAVGISKWTIYRWIKEGRLKTYQRLSHEKMLISKDALNDFPEILDPDLLARLQILDAQGEPNEDYYIRGAKKREAEERWKLEQPPNVIYILSNRPLHDYVKIGVSNTLSKRIKQLNVGVPVAFQLEYFVPCLYSNRLRSQKAFSIEGDVHEELKNFRVNKHREFFNVTPEKALSKILKRMMCHGPDKLQYIEHRNLLRYIEHRNL